jgi:hypothetical protein
MAVKQKILLWTLLGVSACSLALNVVLLRENYEQRERISKLQEAALRDIEQTMKLLDGVLQKK